MKRRKLEVIGFGVMMALFSSIISAILVTGYLIGAVPLYPLIMFWGCHLFIGFSGLFLTPLLTKETKLREDTTANKIRG